MALGQRDCVFSKRPDIDQQACAGCSEATGRLCVKSKPHSLNIGNQTNVFIPDSERFHFASNYVIVFRSVHMISLLTHAFCQNVCETHSSLTAGCYPFGAGIIFFLILAHLYIKCE